MSARLEIECRAATFDEAKADAVRKVEAMCADGWQFISAKSRSADRVVIVTLERADD